MAICAFKILSRNETAAGVGHQSGFLITREMRGLFPDLPTEVTEQHPTNSVEISVTKIVDGYTIGHVRARYQIQTWHGSRSPEYRMTNGLSDLISAALPGDMLVIYPEHDNPYRMAAEIVRQNNPLYEELANMTRGARYGVATVPQVLIERRHENMQAAVAEMETALHNMPFARNHNQPPELVEENPLDEQDRQTLEQVIERLNRIEARLDTKPVAVTEVQQDTQRIWRKLARFMAHATGQGVEAFMKSFGKTLGPIVAVGVPVMTPSLLEKVSKVVATLEPWLASLNLF